MTRSIWEDERAILWLRKLYGTKSAREIAKEMSREFGVVITRNSVIGKLGRLGLTRENTQQAERVARGPRALRKPKPARKPVFRLIKAGGGNAVRLLETITGELPAGPVCTEIEPLNLTLAQLESHHCRWIMNDLYCGHPVRNKPGFQEEKSSYCKWHHVIVWRAPLPRAPTPQRVA